MTKEFRYLDTEAQCGRSIITQVTEEVQEVLHS